MSEIKWRLENAMQLPWCSLDLPMVPLRETTVCERDTPIEVLLTGSRLSAALRKRRKLLRPSAPRTAPIQTTGFLSDSSCWKHREGYTRDSTPDPVQHAAQSRFYQRSNHPIQRRNVFNIKWRILIFESSRSIHHTVRAIPQTQCQHIYGDKKTCEPSDNATDHVIFFPPPLYLFIQERVGAAGVDEGSFSYAARPGALLPQTDSQTAGWGRQTGSSCVRGNKRTLRCPGRSALWPHLQFHSKLGHSCCHCYLHAVSPLVVRQLQDDEVMWSATEDLCCVRVRWELFYKLKN